MKIEYYTCLWAFITFITIIFIPDNLTEQKAACLVLLFFVTGLLTVGGMLMKWLDGGYDRGN